MPDQDGSFAADQARAMATVRVVEEQRNSAHNMAANLAGEIAGLRILLDQANEKVVVSQKLIETMKGAAGNNITPMKPEEKEDVEEIV